MAGLPGNLTCDCTSDLFTEVFKLQNRQGLVKVPAGYRCNACLAIVDSAYLTRRAEAVAKRKQADALTAEADAMAPSLPKPGSMVLGPLDSVRAGR